MSIYNDLTENKMFTIDLDNIIAAEKTCLSHNFHPYPAKYIPHIPRALMQHLGLSKNTTVLDPFCGSGTTLLESSLSGINSIGIDSNPIACLVAKVKTTPLSKEQLEDLSEIINLISSDYNLLIESSRENLPNFLNRDHWFQMNMLVELNALYSLIEQVKSPSVKDFLKVAFSSIIVKCSNQESDTRWVAVKKNLMDRFAINSFLRKLQDMKNRIEETSPLLLEKANVHNADSSSMPFIDDDSVDCVITSPPYMNSFDYYLYHKLRMYWLGFDHYEVQRTEIGSRNKHSDMKAKSSVYSESMFKVAKELKRTLKKGGHACFVIGDSVVKNEVIKMDKEYNKIMEKCDFILTESFSFNQRKYTSAFTRNLKTHFKQTHILIYKA